MIFGCQTEGGSRKLKNYLKPDKDAQRIRRAHDLGYSLNLKPSDSAYIQQPYSKFENQPSMISLGHLGNRHVSMNYPPGQHIHPHAPHISGFPAPTPWPPYDANVGPHYNHHHHHHHPESPKCSNCRRDLSQRYNNNHNTGLSCCTAKSRKCQQPYRNCACTIEKEIDNFSQLNNCGNHHLKSKEKSNDITCCEQCMDIDPHFEQINNNKLTNIKPCTCMKCESESLPTNYNKCQHNCNNLNKQTCIPKTHVPNCVQHQNLRSNLQTHDQIHAQYKFHTETPHETSSKNKHIFESQGDQECCNNKPNKLHGLNSAKDLSSSSQNAQCIVTPVKVKPKSTFVSPFKCPNCSYSCMLNIISAEKNSVDNGLCSVHKSEEKFCDNNFCDNTEPITAQECERKQYIFKYPGSVKETCNEDFGLPEIVVNDTFNSDCAKSLINFNEDIAIAKEPNSFEYANCIGSTSRNEIVASNPVLQISTFQKEQPNQHPVFLNVLQKEEVIWFSS